MGEKQGSSRMGDCINVLAGTFFTLGCMPKASTADVLPKKDRHKLYQHIANKGIHAFKYLACNIVKRIFRNTTVIILRSNIHSNIKYNTIVNFDHQV
ncbi:hypothetical protein HR09_09535 [Porphyromonas gulae]|nr:hypothetical protein HR09_09535 [Porphyromonas gulae]